MTTEIAKPEGKRMEQGQIVERMLGFLPSCIDRERWKQFAIAVIRDPKLSNCSPTSILTALAECGRLGLYPDRNLGHAWLVPFKSECQLIVGYQGYIELARRSGRVKVVHTELVYRGEDCRYWVDDQGPHIQHNFDPFNRTADRKDIVGVYAVAYFSDGGHAIEAMGIAAVEKVRNRSKAKDSGPWQTDYEMMVRKTVIRRGRRYWPQSTELVRAGEIDDAQDDGLPIPTTADELPAGEEPKMLAADDPLAAVQATTTTDKALEEVQDAMFGGGQ